MRSAAVHGLAVAFPSLLRTNDYWRRHHPGLIEGANDRVLSRVWEQKTRAADDDPWARAMKPYVTDPFRGAQSRRWLAPGETSLGLELSAAREVLSACRLAPADVDLAIVSSFLPDHPGVGNAPFFAQELGLRGAAWNLETACSSALVGLQAAASFVMAGQAERVLVVASCTYSRAVSETDTLAWSVGDGACAFVVGAGGKGAEMLSFHTLHTGQTCGAMYYDIVQRDGTPAFQMRAGPTAAISLRETAEWALDRCCREATQKVGLSLRDIGFFATTTPVAWYADFSAQLLGYTVAQTWNSHPMTANNGPVLMPQNLFYGAQDGRIRAGDHVLLHTVGSVSSAAAAVLRWGDVALGRVPDRPLLGE